MVRCEANRKMMDAYVRQICLFLDLFLRITAASNVAVEKSSGIAKDGNSGTTKPSAKASC
jgi:hypothetical protein